MEWNDLPDSGLAQQLNAKTLEHPTNTAFDSNAWRSALEAIASPTERDIDLTLAAIHFGTELASLRQARIPSTTEGFNRPRLVRLLAAFANQQYLTLCSLMMRELRAKKGDDILDMDRAPRLLIEAGGGQKMPPDDIITYLIDSLPHWLFHIWQVADDAPSAEPAVAIDFAARASQVVSIEHSLRQLWLNVRWIGTSLSMEDEVLLVTPRDRILAERWFIFDQRQTMLVMAEHLVDAGAGIVMGRRLPPVIPVIPRTVIRMERQPSGNRKFITGRALGTRPEQRQHVSERDMLERLYTGLFMDEPLPKSPRGQLTCRKLSAAWCILQDLARLAANDLGSSEMINDNAIGRFALTIERNELATLFSDCLEVDMRDAVGLVNWFTCDPADTARMFAKSFWSEPLLPEPNSERRHIVLAPLLVGSPVKRLEAWMERGGISDSRGIKGRGKPFERHVRTALATALVSNPMITDGIVAEHAIKRKGDSEEIDLLVRIGDTVIVGEVKCLVAPSDPIENHNHLDNLSKATVQALNKHAWAVRNRDVIATALGIRDLARASTLEFYPLVLLNNSFGMGLERNGVPIVDLHYLQLLLAGASYQSAMRFERDVGVVSHSVNLYQSQGDLEGRLDDLLHSPPPLRRYEGTVKWRRIPFMTSNGRPFYIEIPALASEPMPNPLRGIPRHNGFQRS